LSTEIAEELRDGRPRTARALAEKLGVDPMDIVHEGQHLRDSGLITLALYEPAADCQLTILPRDDIRPRPPRDPHGENWVHPDPSDPQLR
jgi:hypothetical protein